MNDLLFSILFIGSAVSTSLKLLAGGLLIGSLLGSILAIMRYCGICKKAANRFVSIVRGTPLLLQLGVVYFSVPGLIGARLDVITAGIIAFGLNSSAYMAEVLRSGIDSLSKGQFEAAKTLGIPGFFMWKDIILPQVIRNSFSSIVNEVVALLKETSIISAVGGFDIMRASQIVSAQQFEYFVPLCIAGAYYYILVLIIEYTGRKIESKIVW
jgi:polar amino acid transport system permease protein